MSKLVRTLRTLLFALLPFIVLITNTGVSLAANDAMTITDISEQCAEGWHQSYEAYGREIIISLNNIIVPDVDNVPLFLVRRAPAVPESAIAGYFATANQENNLAIWLGEMAINKFYDGNKMRIKPDRVFLAPDIDWEYTAQGSDLSVEDAVAFLQQVLSETYDEEISNSIFVNRIVVDGLVHQYDKKTRIFGAPVDHPSNRGTYELQAYQEFFGIPLMHSGGGAFEYIKGNEPNMACGINAFIYNREEFGINVNVVEKTKVIFDDIPLLSFDKIKSTIERLISDGRVRDIHSIRLCYVLYHDPIDATVNWAVPTWVCRAELYDNADQEPYSSFDKDAEITDIDARLGDVLINAQTGKFLDPLDITVNRREAEIIKGW